MSGEKTLVEAETEGYNPERLEIIDEEHPRGLDTARPSNGKESIAENEDDLLKSVEAVFEFYGLEGRTSSKSKSKAKYSYESFNEETYDQNSLSNSFKTTGGRKIAKWIKGIQDHIYEDLGQKGCYNVVWKNKTDNKKKFTEIEIKIYDLGVDELGLTIHIFLNTNLIQVKGKMFPIFKNKMLPTIYEYVNNETQTTDKDEGEKCENQAVEELSKEKEKDQELRKEIDLLREKNTGLKDSIELLDAGLTQVLAAMEGIKNTLNDNEVKIKNHLSQLERKYDDKLQMYNEEIKRDFKKETNNLKSIFKDKLNEMERKMQQRIQDMEDNLHHLENLQTNGKKQEEIILLQDQKIEELNQKIQILEISNSKKMAQPQKSFAEIVTTEGQMQDSETIIDNQRQIKIDEHKYQQNTLTKNTGSNKSLLVLMDSNRRYIDQHLLWRGSKMMPCGNLNQAISTIESIKENKPDAILIHTGVNDLEAYSVEQVFQNIKALIESCQKYIPTSRIILSEITPRMDILDRDVFRINRLIHENYSNINMITIVKHHSLRNSNTMRDNKHVSETEGTLKLAKNLKFGIRKAFGIQGSKYRASEKSEWRSTQTYYKTDPKMEKFRKVYQDPQSWNGIVNEDGNLKIIKDLLLMQNRPQMPLAY